MSLFIRFYVLATLSYMLIQLAMAIVNWLLQKQQEPRHANLVETLLEAGDFPTISVIFPIYNETPEILTLVMEHAIECLTIPGLELIFVDDGSPNRDDLDVIYKKFEQRYHPDQLLVVRQYFNGGKRVALNMGFEIATGDYLITADSDTLINPDGVKKLIAPLLADARLGAVTGDVQVANYGDTWLTHLISLRYWISFHVERGAQSLSGSMMVCSGPFTVYRRSIIRKVRKDFVSQKFLGQACTYGDDRHLTWLVLSEGYLTRIQEGAIAYTMAPRKIPEYIPQQVRWTKSFIREIFWVLPKFHRISLFSLLDTIYQPLISFCFMFALSNVVFLFFRTMNPYILVGEVVILLLMASLRSVYGLIRTANLNFIRFPLYGFIHILVILPLRWKALFSLRDIAWGTRLSRKTNSFRDFLVWQGFFFGVVIFLAVIANLLIPSQTILIQSLSNSNFGALTQYFIGTLLSWWSQAIWIVLILTPIFLFLGLRRSGIRYDLNISELQSTAKVAIMGTQNQEKQQQMISQ